MLDMAGLRETGFNKLRLVGEHGGIGGPQGGPVAHGGRQRGQGASEEGPEQQEPIAPEVCRQTFGEVRVL